MARGRRYVSRGTGSRRKMVWARIAFTGFNVDYGAGTTAIAPFRFDALQQFEAQLGSDLLGVTIVRARGIAGILATGTLANNFQAQTLMTAYIGNQNEVTRGPDANDNAFFGTSASKDYFLYEPFMVRAGGQSLEDTHNRVIDVKSSRKLEELGQALIFDVSGVSDDPTAGALVFGVNLSILLKLA